MSDILKKIALTSVALAAMVSLGAAINVLFPWQYVGYLFALFRSLILPFDFFFDTSTLILLVGLSIFVEGVFWGIRGLIALFSFAGWNK